VLESFQLEEFIDLTDSVKLRFAAQVEQGVSPDDILEAAVDEVLITSPDSCSLPHGDADGNCTIDLADYWSWPACMTGPENGPVGEGCEVFNFDSTDTIDLQDYAAFLEVFGG
jgi:hypothetical protein